MPSTDRMTIADVATHLGVSRWTVYRLIEAGELKSAAGARGPRISTADYAAWLLTQAVNPDQKDGHMPTSPPALPTMFAFEDVAKQYGLSLRSLLDSARAKAFTHTRIGSKRYFTSTQLDAFLAARAVESKQDTSLDAMRSRRARRARRSSAAA